MSEPGSSARSKALRVLLDHNVPYKLLRHLTGHDAAHASDKGWGELVNGLLIEAAEADGFEVLITCDQNLEYQNNLSGRRIGLIVLNTNNWTTIRTEIVKVTDAVSAASTGSYCLVAFTRPALRRRPYSHTPDC